MKWIEWEAAKKLENQYGDSYFLFDERIFEDNFRRLRGAIENRYSAVELAYSYKTNYTPYICQLVEKLGGYAEVVSDMEYVLAKRVGVSDRRIIYNGPAKSPESLKFAVQLGSIVNIDSWQDFEIIQQAAQCFPVASRGVAIRCNFDIDGVLESRFGLDVDGEEFHAVLEELRKSEKLYLAGLHCHFPNRDLDSFRRRAEKMVALCHRIFEEPPEFLNLGGGFFGTMSESLQRVFGFKVPSFEDYGRIIGEIFDRAFPKVGHRPILFIEPGTALVANTMAFVTKVISTKQIRGRKIAVVSGSIFNISPTARSSHLPVTILHKRSDVEGNQAVGEVDVCGFTCIENDYLTKSLKGSLEVGDYLVYENVGSYSIVMKPPFILPNVAILRKMGDSDDYCVIKQQESFDWIFKNFKGI